MPGPPPVLVISSGVPGLRGAGTVVADEDGQLALVKGEDQPDEGPTLAAGGEHRVGRQLRDDDLGRIR